MNELINAIADFCSELSTNSRIAELNREVLRLKQSGRPSTRSDGVATQFDELRSENAELRLYIAVLFRVLHLKGIVGREDLARLIDEVDAEDGKHDQVHTGEILP